jgi:FG-GAP-like repeat
MNKPAVCCALAGLWGTSLYGQASVLTWHNDNGRSGQNLQERILTPANVNSSTFGRLTTISVDGKVDAQPLYVHGLSLLSQGTRNILYVATEHDSVYAFDADNFTQLLRVSMLKPGETPSDDRGCSQVVPEIGVTATPAIDLQAGPHGTMYVVAMSKDASGNYHHRLHALDLTTLAEEFGGPVEIQASFPGTGAENTFVPRQHKERPGLLISNGTLYTTWGSHCDAPPYAGWVLSYNETTLAQVGVLSLEPNGVDGGLWAAGSGPAADSSGNIFLVTGNGTFDTTLNQSGFPNGGDFGNAFVKISTNGSLAVTDYFTMDNTVAESNGDVDLDSAGLMLLPALNNAQGQAVSLVVGAGKDGNIYVLNQNNMGRFSSSTDSIYQQLTGALPGGTWSSPAWFNGTLYYGGVGDKLMAFGFSNGMFSVASESTNVFGYPGTTPSISANGSSNGILWAVDNQSTAVLYAYDATNLATQLYNSNQAANQRDHFGAGNKFIVPTIANGKVYVGTTTGVGVFGLFQPPKPVQCDFNRDRHPDLIWQNDSTSQVLLWYMGGAGGTSLLSTNWISQAGEPGWRVVAIADFNRDGIPDIVWENTSTSQVLVWYMGGSGGNVVQSEGWISSAGEPGWQVVAAADFNGDGIPDILWENNSTNQVILWYMGGSGGTALQSASWISSGGEPGWQVMAAADFNGDGVPDILWENTSTSQVILWYMGGTQGGILQSASWISSGGEPGWRVAGAADFNGDGVPDILWENTSTRQVILWYMGGTQGGILQSLNWISETGEPSWSVIN